MILKLRIYKDKQKMDIIKISLFLTTLISSISF